VLKDAQGSTHPKIAATVRRVVDLWERGEKVLVFAFYRRTCRAIRIHISEEINRRLYGAAGHRSDPFEPAVSVDAQVESAQKRFFDDTRAKGRRALDRALVQIAGTHDKTRAAARLTAEQRDESVTVMRRFLRAPTTLMRCFPLADEDALSPDEAVERMLSHMDGSGTSWRQKFHTFIDFLVRRCSSEERRLYLEAASRTQTGGIRVEDEDDEDAKVAVANVQVAMGTTRRETRQRLMRAFNTPFFPDILVCSEVMGEGVDLHRFCRHVIHHDLAWNPSTIEQRTGRIDRLGCKAEGRQPIEVYLPYLSGTADERMYQVMSHREQWFRVVMGQEEVAKLITPDTEGTVPLPATIADELGFHLGLDRA
jgi:ERCC4-related helicase